MDSIKKPPVSPGYPVGRPQYKAGAPRSVGRLRHLNFDPIGELVSRYRMLEKDVENYRKIRSGELIELLPSGKHRAFSYDVLMQLEQKLIDIGDKLLRYGYGRVPEAGLQEVPKLPSMHIQLTKPGEVFVLNAQAEDEEEFEFIDNEADN